ncbi:MAG: hypothetical protein II759_03960 [Lachnospiraceae bacterium]|nr:hypothetical protein [Lachnospiraceae bacterium]
MNNKECCGVYRSGNRLYFSTVLNDASDAAGRGELFLVLYLHREDGKYDEKKIALTKEDCLGNLVRTSVVPESIGFDPELDLYGYMSGENRIPDPYADGYLSAETPDNMEFTGCTADVSLSGRERPAECRSRTDWNRRFIYQCHVRGLTISRQNLRDESIRGTFEGMIQMIPHILSLGATTVELMPVAAPRCRSAASGSAGAAVRESRSSRTDAGFHDSDYWGFHPAALHALNPVYAPSGNVRKTASSMRKLSAALHGASLELIFQIYLSGQETPQEIQDMLRYYALEFGADGFHLIGAAPPWDYCLSDPVLAGLLFIGEGLPSRTDTAVYSDDYAMLLRQLVKGDDFVLKSFLSSFAGRKDGTGDIRYITDYRGFTLLDLVSYSRKHNEANGEDNRDGEDRNFSWNCGAEGETSSRTINLLRQQQIRNFLALLLLGGGTPLLFSGDEALNTQFGNNNPYNQDNETGHILFRRTRSAKSLTAFVGELMKFRGKYTVLTSPKPYRCGDYLGLGYPDFSLHGEEAWKPDLGPYSHTVGIMFNQGYAEENPVPGEGPLIYIAVNCYWEEASFGLPKLSPGFVWAEVMNTVSPDGFSVEPRNAGRPDSVRTAPRSVSVYVSMRSADAGECSENAPAVPAKERRK